MTSSPLLRAILRSHPVVAATNAYYQRRITSRHVFAIIGSFVVLWTFFSFTDSSPSHYLSSIVPVAPTTPETWTERAEQVKDAFRHAYSGYETLAYPHDELKPLSELTEDGFNGWGVTLYDSLDTMIIMGLDEEYKRALRTVERETFPMKEGKYAPFFETVIRYLGGLLSAYALTKDDILLQKADELGTKLSPAFNTSSGFPLYGVNTASGAVQGPQIGILAEIASCQLEYEYLAHVTGSKEHFDRADAVIKGLAKADLLDLGGMAPIRWNISSGQPYDTRLSVGSQADSTHEYLLKHYLLTAQTDATSLQMYLDTVNQILSSLLYVSPTRHLLYVTDVSGKPGKRQPSHKFEHLSCFLPGLLALGAHTLPLRNITPLVSSSDERDYNHLAGFDMHDLHMWAAEGLAETCYRTYADMPSGLGPDEMRFTESGSSLWIKTLQKWKSSGARGSPPGTAPVKSVIYSPEERLLGAHRGRKRDYSMYSTKYMLRPETVESLFYMWKITGDVKWREYGWDIFQAIELHTKTASGYANIRAVDVQIPPKEDFMPSYFLAETLKYLYLMFANEDTIPLDRWVYNTEAHPLPVFEWSEREKMAFGIA